MDFTSTDYIAKYFRISYNDLVKVKELWKDLVMKVLLEREQGVSVYNTQFVPENNIDNK